MGFVAAGALLYAFPAYILSAGRRGESFGRAESTAIVGAALLELFAVRARSRELLLWQDPVRDAPVFGNAAVRSIVAPYQHNPARPSRLRPFALAVVDSAALVLPIPWRPVRLATLEAHFREHAAGWDSWFRLHPGSTGVVEVTVPIPEGEARDRASVLVGRACGEHCRNAWRVTLRRSEGVWRADSVVALPMPRS